MKTKWPQAIPTRNEVATDVDVGPCQMDGCHERARVRVSWLIEGYGSVWAWYCEAHAPEVDP